MPESKKKNALAAPRGPVKHGLYSWVKNKRLPRAKAFQKVRRELGTLRDELMERHGGQSATPEARVLIDNVIEALGVQKILGCYVYKYGVIDAQAAKRGRLELSPLLSKSWVSYANTVRQGILALKEIGKDQERHGEPVLAEIIREYDEKARESAVDTRQSVPGATNGPDEGGRQGEEGEDDV